MTYQHITYDEAEGIVTITINRPEVLNALAYASVEELIHALDRARDEGTARVVLLTANGRAFCSGADISGNAPTEEPRLPPGPPDAGAGLERWFNPLVERIAALPLPVVAGVNGLAAGGGCGIALAADIVIAARSAYFLQPFANIGLVPDCGATWLLPRLIGKPRATAMMLLADKIPAETAHEWGMIWQVVDDGELASTARAMAERLAKGPTQTYALTKQGIAQCQAVGLSEALAIERHNQRLSSRTEDHAEGVASFREKRKAAFKGR